MNTQELIEKANRQFQEKKLDEFLSAIYDEIKHYYSWKHNQDDFETRWNFGLKNIDREDVDIRITRNKKIDTLLVAEFNNIKFKIGGEFDDNYHIVFFLNDKLVINAVYSHETDPYSKYTFIGLEEFHYSKELEEFLNNTSKVIEKFKKEQEQMRKNEHYKIYDGKFTLDE